jgi:hypothetical protein
MTVAPKKSEMNSRRLIAPPDPSVVRLNLAHSMGASDVR